MNKEEKFLRKYLFIEDHEDTKKIMIPMDKVIRLLKAYTIEVKDIKKISNDRDKKSAVESTGANDSKPVIGSVPSGRSKDFLSVKEQANPDRLNSDSAYTEKKCHCTVGCIDINFQRFSTCNECHHWY